MRNPDCHDAMHVTLNVGGTFFHTTTETLQAAGHRFFVRMAEQAREGRVLFIDRDGAPFQAILNYLRDGRCVLPSRAEELQALEHEAHFYCLSEIEDLARTAHRDARAMAHASTHVIADIRDVLRARL